MPNQITLTFAGDAQALIKASKQADQAVTTVGTSVTAATVEFKDATSASDKFAAKMGSLGAAVGGMSTAIEDAGGSLQALVDIQQAGAQRAARQARALSDVEQAGVDAEQAVRDLAQAQLDLNQSMLDGQQATADATQAAIDMKQAALDARVAQTDYNAAVREHGKNSAEAQQAAIDLEQANQDLRQANIDAQQATADFQQAQEDGRQATVDAKQATVDATTAQLDLNDAQREAHPPELQRWANDLNMVTPLINAVVGVVGLVTAAQWAWNAAQLASPTTWIVLAIAALVAIIVVIATKTDWFQKAWKAAWGGIKTAASAVWDWLKGVPDQLASVFSTVADTISAPFRAAFNFVADAWNNTIGSLSWTVPRWIPEIGGSTISAPQLPKFHSGGIVPGALGQEMLAVLQAGEQVIPAGAGGARTVLELRSSGSRIDDLLVEILARAIKGRGGNVQVVLGR